MAEAVEEGIRGMPEPHPNGKAAGQYPFGVDGSGWLDRQVRQHWMEISRAKVEQ